VGADAFNCSRAEFNKKWLTNIKLNNIPVNIYTINDAKNMRRFLNMGVSGIFTNNSDILKRVAADIKTKGVFYDGSMDKGNKKSMSGRHARHDSIT
jgi:hypothetical protein